MILHRLSLMFLISTTVIVIVSLPEARGLIPTHCQHSCGVKSLPYPLGFSTGCPIHLTCNETGLAKIGEFVIQNVTSSSIIVSLPTECNRPLNKIKDLFSQNYAPSWNNSFLLQRCGNSSHSCFINQSFVADQFPLKKCEAQNDITCFSRGNFTNKTVDLMSYEDVNRSQCQFIFSGITLDKGSKESGISLQFERVDLGWWIPGRCSNTTCANNGNCTNIDLAEGRQGHRCWCREGLRGDGFATGLGCKAASGCNGSRYISGKCGGTKIGILVGGILAGAALMAGMTVMCYCIRRRSASMKIRMTAKRLLCEAAGNSTVPFYPFKEIEKATNGFDDNQRLGTGAYGTVYAGKLNGEEWVAIKRLRHRDTDSVDQVMNEMKLLSCVSHPNLVRLLGCCIEKGEPILVYEYMPNGTLSQHLQMEKEKSLSWMKRLTIATQTAKAIAYLHSAMNPPIYHRDIKSSNILLDYDYNSKVADFGLSRLGLIESSHISTAPQGTPGYLDPQYHQYFHLSDKSDVYSFGVVLVEIITALKVVDFSRSQSEVNLAALAIDRIGRGCVDDIIDQSFEPNRDAWTLSSVHNVAELAFRCLAFHGDMRPTMTEVAEELEQIRLSAWVPNMYLASSPAASYCSSENGSEKSFGGASVTNKKRSKGSTRLIVPQRIGDCLTPLDEIRDNSPVSVQDAWLSQQSSPSTNSLLGNVIH